MTDDYGCKVCGKHFEEEEDLKTHGKDDHPEVQEAYPDIFDKDAKVEEPKEAEEFDWDEIPEEEWDDVVLRKVNGEPEEEKPAEEIDQQEDKPTQSHDDWLEDLKGLKDDFATEQEKCAICNGEHPTSEHPVSETHEEETKTEIDPVEPAEEGGADDPLSKVEDLAESYRFMSRDKRTNIFESLGFGQGDSAILSGLEWNELTRPIKVEASEAFAKEEDVPAEPETGEDEEEEENKAYENLYNLEKYHSSPDYKKKSLTCNKCNEAFYNINDRNVHFNDVHATEQEYELPEQCPFCKEIIQEPNTLDWHMQEEHGAHVASQFTQTGLQGAMADTDFDSLESHKKAGEAFDTDWACPRCGSNSVKIKYEDGIPVGRECPKCGLGQESYAKESKSSSELKEEIRKQKEFINMASFENPLNMGDAEDKLHNLESELESLGGEELESTEGEGGHQDLEDTTEYPDDPEEEQEKAEEDGYVDDSDNVEEKYVCPDCDEEFNSDEQLKEHQYANYHGKYKDEGEGEDMPRNVMGGY